MKKRFINKKNVEFYNIKYQTQGAVYDILGFNPKKGMFDIKEKHISVIKKYKAITQINTKVGNKHNIFFYNIKTCKNIRNVFGYPSRGQRTRTNAKTKKKYKLKISL